MQNSDARGAITTNVKQADRYVVNVRKKGFALNSRIYDSGITGGRWVLYPAHVQTVDPTQDITLTHQRSEANCPGPASKRAKTGIAGASLTALQWQDGRGNVIDAPPADKESIVVNPQTLKLTGCSVGVSVFIPANSIVDENNQLVRNDIDLTISTVDLLTPDQMPGDESVIASNGNGGYIESFGAGSLDFPPGLRIKDNASATVTIPVDRARKIGGAALPATVPLLSYDEKAGLWIEEGTLSLEMVAGVQSYVGETKHFSAFNADNVRVNASCIRIFSPGLPTKYDLEVSSPLGGTGAPKIVKKEIDQTNGTEHVVYNLPNDVNVTMAPMTQGNTPSLLGFYVVNSGPAQNPNTAPNPPPGFPYVSCNNFVTFAIDSAPDSPFGGEFLHGLGFIDAANLGGLAGLADDLTYAAPTGNALRDALVDASRNYYDTLDPAGDLNSFEKFKDAHGFSQNPNAPAANEIVASYANSGDLGFGRDMHCIKKLNDDVVCYVTNYGIGYTNIYDPGTNSGPGTVDIDDANAAASRSTVGASTDVATVAMEYSTLPGAPATKVVKFYVYKKALTTVDARTPTNPLGAYARSISANLDGQGERPVPQLCMVCHGGQVPEQTAG
ncbi:MAG: hypothetical protein ACI8WB_004731, partial [Phenylobacterium sp.]